MEKRTLAVVATITFSVVGVVGDFLHSLGWPWLSHR
jgi:hypothetical protein